MDADVLELADKPVLETGAYACRFKSCHPHQKESRLNEVALFLLCKDLKGR